GAPPARRTRGAASARCSSRSAAMCRRRHPRLLLKTQTRCAPSPATGSPRRGASRGAPGGGGLGRGGTRTLYLFACPLPIPPAEVGFIRLRPVNRWPNSGKPEFGCKRGRGRRSRPRLSVVRGAPRCLAHARYLSAACVGDRIVAAVRALPRHSAADIRAP